MVKISLVAAKNATTKLNISIRELFIRLKFHQKYKIFYTV